MIARVSGEPLDVSAHEAAVWLPAAGARVVFAGVVRDVDRGHAVRELEYEAHPDAESVLAGIVAEFEAAPHVLSVAVSHRVGLLQVGEVALVAAVSTEHRAEAFRVCADLVDEVKRRLPVWKRQVFLDGTDEWVDCP